MSISPHAEKRETMLSLLDRGLVMVHLDPRFEGVVVPDCFGADPTLRLNIAYGFNLPALQIDDEGIYAVLSFGGVNHGCTLPWEAVYAITLPDQQHEGRMWTGSLPAELAEAASAVVEAPPAPTLRIVGDDADEVVAEADKVVAEADKVVVEADEVVAEADEVVAESPESPGEAEAAPTPPRSGRPALRLVTD